MVIRLTTLSNGRCVARRQATGDPDWRDRTLAAIRVLKTQSPAAVARYLGVAQYTVWKRMRKLREEGAL